MASISSLGVGSGLDIAGIVKQLIDAEGSATSKRLDTRETELQAKLTALGNLKSAFSDFRSSYSALSSAATYDTTSVNLSNSSYFSVTTSGTVDVGSHTVEVKQLAREQKLSSTTFAATNSTVGTGTLSIDFGTYTYDASNNVTGFTANPNKTTQTINITDGSLSGIKDAINAANIGATASIINDGTGYRLVLTSDSGAENALKISVTGDSDGNDTDNAGLSALTYDPLGTGAFMTENQTAMDSIVAIDGIDITSATNTVSGALSNMSLNLTQAAPGTVVSLTATHDTSGIRDALQAFVDGYNSMMTTVNQATFYDAKNDTHGILIGDASVRNAVQQMRNVLNTRIQTQANATYDSFASLGILTNRDGTLELNTLTLSKALSEKPDEVAALLSGGAKPTSDNQISYRNIPSNLTERYVPIDITQLATQGTYTGTDVGTVGTPYDLSVGSFTFDVTVDGTNSGTLTLTNANYGTGDAVAAHIEQIINASSSLKAAGKGVTVTYDATTRSYSIASNSYGSNSNVNISNESADVSNILKLGAAIGTATVGVNVEGTLGGLTATGLGQTLSGTGTYAGLEVDILGGSLGSRSSIKIFNGLIDNLDTALNGIIDSGGTIDSETTGLLDSVDQITEQRKKLALRLSSLQDRYIKQFSAMDSLVAQLNSTGSFLTNQLASLPGAKKG